MAVNQPLIKLEGVTKVFHADEVETHALSNVNLEIQKGEYVAISGPSGCGKSTLLSILGLLDSPTSGDYWLDGKSVANLSTGERARIRNREIGFIFQAFNLIGDLSVYENVELPLTYRGMVAAERKQRVERALQPRGSRGPHAPLSRATFRWAATARRGGKGVGGRTLYSAGRRTYTGNLDSKSGESVMELLHELHREGATICLVTHDQHYSEFAERTIHLLDGCVVRRTRTRAWRFSLGASAFSC